jgi:hypothetical protein
MFLAILSLIGLGITVVAVVLNSKLDLEEIEEEADEEYAEFCR